MKIQRVDDDSPIWRHRVAVNAEVRELIRRLERAKPGVTYAITLKKPFKLLPATLRKHLGSRRSFQVKRRDDTYRFWYVRLEAKSSILRINSPLLSAIPDMDGNPTSN